MRESDELPALFTSPMQIDNREKTGSHEAANRD